MGTTAKKMSGQEPQQIGGYAVVRVEGDSRQIVRLADGARFAIAYPDSGRVTCSWSGMDAEAWLQVLRNPRFADRIAREGGVWLHCEQAGAEGVPAVQPEPDDDFEEFDDLPDSAALGAVV